MIRGERVLSHFDELRVDPMTTIARAIEAVDRSEVMRLEAVLGSAKDNEYLAAKKEFETALRTYKWRVAEYAAQNPVHFEPRLNEVVF